jgi:hypothetical protein
MSLSKDDVSAIVEAVVTANTRIVAASDERMASERRRLVEMESEDRRATVAAMLEKLPTALRSAAPQMQHGIAYTVDAAELRTLMRSTSERLRGMATRLEDDLRRDTKRMPGIGPHAHEPITMRNRAAFYVWAAEHLADGAYQLTEHDLHGLMLADPEPGYGMAC